MLGRHNMTIYADELERTIGAIGIVEETHEMGEREAAYWQGARHALRLLLATDMPNDHAAFVAAMKMHWEET